jgi:cytochrome c biogenesis protein CcdA
MSEVDGHSRKSKPALAALAACAEFAILLLLCFGAVSGARVVLTEWLDVRLPDTAYFVAYLLGLAFSFWVFGKRFNRYMDKWVVRK